MKRDSRSSSSAMPPSIAETFQTPVTETQPETETRKSKTKADKSEPQPQAPRNNNKGLTNLWTYYKVQWTFLQKVCASVPADPELVAAWIAARQPAVRPPGGKTINQIQEEVFATIAQPPADEEEQQSLLVFQREHDRLVLRAATIRAHIKDCARVLSAQYIGKIQGERSFATRVINGVYLDESQYWIPIQRLDDSFIKEADGRRDKAVHVRSRTGEMLNALKTFEYVEEAKIEFTLKVLGESVKQEDLEILMSYGGVHGYGGERGDGEGRYQYVIEPMPAPQPKRK